jgi:hypothetical protein
LILKPQTVLLELFCFLLEVPSLTGTVVEKRIADYCAKGNTSAVIYKLKAPGTRNLSRNVSMFSEEEMEILKTICREYLYFFNYTDHPEGKADPDTTFFTYDRETQHDAVELEKRFGGY